MSIKRTINKPRSIKGKSLRTGEDVTLTIKPIEPSSGFIFAEWTYMDGLKLDPPHRALQNWLETPPFQMGTQRFIQLNILSALIGCRIDNAVIEIDASEPPILDGSAKLFVDLIKAEPVDLTEDRKFLKVQEPLSVSSETVH